MGDEEHHTTVQLMTEVERQAHYEKLAHKQMQLAEKAILKRTIANFPQLKYREAIDNYHIAARAYGVAGEWQDSSEAYGKASDQCVHIGLVAEGAYFSVKAAEVLKKVDPTEAVVFFRNAVSLYCEIGRFFTAGNVQREVAEMLELDKNYEECREAFRQASDYYLGGQRQEPANQCLLKVAHYSALVEDFDYASETFEKVARDHVTHNLLRLNVHDHLFKGGLCQLAAQGPIRKGLESHKVGPSPSLSAASVGVTRPPSGAHPPAHSLRPFAPSSQNLQYLLKKWALEVDYSFVYSRHHLFLMNLMEIIPSLDIDNFADHVYNFDNVSGLDQWSIRFVPRPPPLVLCLIRGAPRPGESPSLMVCLPLPRMLNRVKEDITEEIERRDRHQKREELKAKRAKEEAEGTRRVKL